MQTLYRWLCLLGYTLTWPFASVLVYLAVGGGVAFLLIGIITVPTFIVWEYKLGDAKRWAEAHLLFFSWFATSTVLGILAGAHLTTSFVIPERALETVLWSGGLVYGTLALIATVRVKLLALLFPLLRMP